MAGKHISLPSPFKEGDPTEWFQRYEICCTANEWSEAIKLAKLPTLLEGEALAVWLDLAPEDQRHYDTAKEKILGRMSPVKFVSLEEFHARKLLPGESLSVFVHQLKRLLNQAMPTVDAGTKGQLLLHQFVTGLPSRVSKQLRAVGEINDLDKVLERAKLLLTMDEQEQTAAIKTTERPLEMEVLQQQVSVLSEQVAALTSRLPRGRSTALRRCYNCRQPGHLQRNCPEQRRCYSCGRQGHTTRECRAGNERGAFHMGQGRPGRQ